MAGGHRVARGYAKYLRRKKAEMIREAEEKHPESMHRWSKGVLYRVTAEGNVRIGVLFSPSLKAGRIRREKEGRVIKVRKKNYLGEWYEEDAEIKRTRFVRFRPFKNTKNKKHA